MKILGLDLGANSIGWAVVDSDNATICGSGSRIIPMNADDLSDFGKGKTVSQTKQRTQFRGVRRLRARHLLRRERLHRVLNILGFLPEHYVADLIFSPYSELHNHSGQIAPNREPKLAWVKKPNGKYDFLFKDSFMDMIEDIRQSKPEQLSRKSNGEESLVPYDWTMYYLRKKALTEKISEQELAWILLNFNQKRGYYQLRGEEEEEDDSKLVEFHEFKVVEVIATGNKKGNDTWYSVILENGWIYPRSSKYPLDEWIGTIRGFIVTTDLDKEGNPKKDKEGKVKRSFRSPDEKDWMLLKKRSESKIIASGKTVGEYIYDTLLYHPDQKIKGKLIQTIERKFYKEELEKILNAQISFHEKLKSEECLQSGLVELYPNNKLHRESIKKRGFLNLFINDIIFYQRPLKSKKSLIADCHYEVSKYIDKDSGVQKDVPLKGISRSHPLFQEFRLWKFISALRVYKHDNANNIDVTSEFITDYVKIFEMLNDKKEIDQKGFLSLVGVRKSEISKYEWNNVDKAYPCNETRSMILSKLKKANVSLSVVDDPKNLVWLWHILYSIKDMRELKLALRSFAQKNSIHINEDQVELFVETLSSCKPFDNDYAKYSEKAIKKLLPLMRMGKYWREEDIDKSVLCRINNIINGEFDENIDDRTREKCSSMTQLSHFSGVADWLACYVVYGSHSEAMEVRKWNTPEDINLYLNKFRQHSLRNPVVEKVVMETLRVVRDIWKRYDSFDAIHIELGRDMKNPSKAREMMTKKITANEDTNLRIKRLLQEFSNPEYGIENVRPYSPNQQDKLKIYEDGVLNSGIDIPDDINAILKAFKEKERSKQPSNANIMRYRLWLEQSYRSPYTGEIIPLGKLFTTAYQIEHIIPQAKFFDNSFNNKVVCESEVNKLKEDELAFNFIKSCKGETKIRLASGKDVTILSVEDYEKAVSENYANNRSKMKKLLATEVPDDFNSRQLSDTRYISKMVMELLSNVVREEKEREIISKNIVSCNGTITDRLKKDWGLVDVWNKIMTPRFERLNELTNSNTFGSWENKEGKKYFQTNMPIELSKGFNKKRIDHRHHAMDAIVIACATRNHVNFLNNESARDSNKRYDLRSILCHKRYEEGSKKDYKWIFNKPWDNFTKNVSDSIGGNLVSFKQNLRVINKTNNKTLHYGGKDEERTDKKVLQDQIKGDRWAIRKSMHKDTVYGKVNLQSVKEAKLTDAVNNWQRIVDREFKQEIKAMVDSGNGVKEIIAILKNRGIKTVSAHYFSDDNDTTRLVATRKKIDDSFNVKKIETITDSGIREIMLAHLENNENNLEKAFSPEGVMRMNENIRELNKGKSHKPIYKVRVSEALGNKYPIGYLGNKSTKYVVADAGTNLFFAVYKNDKAKREYDTIPLNIAIERQKQGLYSVPEEREGCKLIFTLSPTDLVYIPTPDQIGCEISIDEIDVSRIYKFVDSSGTTANFVPYYVASSILSISKEDVKQNGLEGNLTLLDRREDGEKPKKDKILQDEYGVGSLKSKNPKATSGELIKEICIPIKVDRLGKIVKI